MKTEKPYPACSCTNCDRSCYQQSGPSGVLRSGVGREEALRRVRELKESLAGGDKHERA